MQHHFVTVLAAVALAGCPDPGTGGGNDPAELVGSWQEVVQDPSETPETLELRADGTYTLDTGDLETGTYVANAQTLTLTSSDGLVDEFPYVVEGDQLIPIALRRETAGAGFVGDWHAEGLEDGEPQSIDLSIRADMTATMEFPTDEGFDQLDGTWRDDTGILVASFVFDFEGQQIPIELRLHSVRGELGAPLYVRQ
jgi:hypothetical protein